MARSGYDPREMANMFKTIEQQGGPGGPQWLSDHPNPGNRASYITAEAKMLRVENPVRDTRGFQQVRAHVADAIERGEELVGVHAALTAPGDSIWITRSTSPMSIPSSSDEVATIAFNSPRLS